MREEHDLSYELNHLLIAGMVAQAGSGGPFALTEKGERLLREERVLAFINDRMKLVKPE